MSADHNRWIISSHKFVEHKTPESAQAELERLKAKAPGKNFRIYRIKRVVAPVVAEKAS
jgi:hypothetical protein